MIEIRKEQEASGQYARARSRLLWIQKSFERNPDLRKRWPTVATGYLYTLALSHVYEAKGERAGLLEARKIVRELVDTLATWISEERPAPDAQSFSPVKIAEMKGSVTPSVVVLASLTARCDPKLADEAIDRLVAGGTPPLEPVPESEWIELDDLCHHVCTLKPWELVDRYVLADPAPWRRTHYNLACYYSSLATLAKGDERKKPCFDIALLALENGLEGGYLIEWADKDPSLKPLRHAREEKFKKILNRHKIDPHPEPKEDDKAAPTDKSTDDKNLLDFLAGLLPGQ